MQFGPLQKSLILPNKQIKKLITKEGNSVTNLEIIDEFIISARDDIDYVPQKLIY